MESCFKLPNEIILSSKLTYSAKRIFAGLHALANLRGTVTKSVHYLALQNYCAASTITKAISNLVRHGYVRRVGSFGYSNDKKAVVQSQNTYVCKRLSGKFTFIPRRILQADIGAAAFTLLCYFYLLKGQKNRAFPSHSRIAADLGMSKNTQQRAIGELVAANLIQREQCLTASNCYVANSYFVVAGVRGPSKGRKRCRRVIRVHVLRVVSPTKGRASLDVDVTPYLSFFEDAIPKTKMRC